MTQGETTHGRNDSRAKRLTGETTGTGHTKTVDERIQSARRCAYSLMGAGLHGQNGVNPMVSLTMWNVFVLPCLLYGLDILTLIKTEISKINQSHKKFLKQIMHLPDRTADAAIYILSDQILD